MEFFSYFYYNMVHGAGGKHFSEMGYKNFLTQRFFVTAPILLRYNKG